ncbi:cytochrome aa3 quinol oxidase subunit IV [Paenibacillus sp. N1-5-1-14]|uniref:cytochrome aa3 quinol oxidase subunit IV n=1 Tax=Paenibacillus radicibacter TaxID=2972488 RepID=UPI002159208A|nr:cytochrome aa3 quinol oxidase subunit IV [Paenibacillus radicibacter]MCR8642806.1 cytochrome aa3 quinol oxidase subunit IV [Paenibacillus radicibacter]
MKQLFPVRHVMGYLFSLILSIVAFCVVFFNMPATVGLAILIVCAIIQASLQLFVFMHVDESKDKKSLYLNILYALFVGLVTIFGTLFVMIWGYQ